MAPLRCLCLAALFALASSRGFAELPTIIQQPQGQTNPYGIPVTFSVVVASSTFLTYQWRFNGIAIPGATSTNYYLPNSQVTNSGLYSVAVTNATGGIISSSATLLVLGPPMITAQPANSTKTQGATATFSVTATGPGPMTYQWFYNTNTLISSGPSNSVSQANVQVWQPGTYHAVVANGYGTTTSSFAQLTVSLGAGMPGCWGNTTEPASTVPPGYSSVNHKAIAAGGAHTLALKTNGSISMWGDNTYGQLISPVLSDIVAVAAGGYHSLALRTNSTVAAWGYNADGQLDVPAGLSNVVSIAAGAQHSLALLSDGTVTAWGNNNEGETNVPPDLTNVVRIAAGYYHNLALKRDGTVVCWGSTNNGECDPPGGLDGVIAIAAGNGFSYALRTNGLIVLWGDNSSGQLVFPPTLLSGTPVSAIAAGGAHCLALKENGAVVAWGNNSLGATNVPAGVSVITGISGGSNHCVALRGSGAPAITCAPWSQSVDPGTNVTFTVFAVGSGTLRYQWLSNNIPISGATNKWLGLTNVQSATAGSYSAVVTNNSGAVTSSVATLTVSGTVTPAPPVWSNVSFDGAGFHARLTGTPGTWVIATSPNLLSWVDMLTTNIPPAGYIDLTDSTATRNGQRYYRAHTP